MNSRILISADVCHGNRTQRNKGFGEQCFRPVETLEEVLEDYTNITKEDIYTALDFGSAV